MNKLHFILIFILFTGFGVSNMNAQSTDQEGKTVYKTSLKETPKEVKAALKNYSGYKISSKATYTKTSKGKIYKVKVQKGHYSNILMIDEKGKVVGIESGEHGGR